LYVDKVRKFHFYFNLTCFSTFISWVFSSKVTDKFHPFDVSFIYFTRLERGPIPVPQTAELRSQVMEKYLLPGLIDKDPIQMLYSYLSQVRNGKKKVDEIENVGNWP